MLDFLICNALVSSLVILFIRFSSATFNAKLLLVGLALTSWVLPLTLLKTFFPNEITLSVNWILPISHSNEVVVNQGESFDWLSHINLTNGLFWSTPTRHFP